MGGAAVSSLLATPTPTSRPRPVSTTTAPFSVNLSTAAARAPRLLLLSRRPRPRPAAAVLGVSNDTGVKMAGSDIVGKNDLLIVGPGVLGRLVAEKWQEEHPGCKVFGQTASTDHHNELSNIGIIPSLKGSTFPQKVPYVIFCAPPSRSDDYPGDVRVAASNWTGEGSFVFTSSTALYDCSDNELCNEDCPSVPIGRSPRTDVLLKAENVVLEAGGCVLRLAGLYISSIDDYLKGTLDTRPDHIINQIHYEDAASLAIAIMKKGHRGRIFLGCDNKPLSRQEIMDSVNRSGKFDTKFQGFTGTDGPLGKKMENSRTRSEIGWEPKYPSFTEFLGLDS
uniref:NAD-dependent epimerase/dehydratase domain-containing protein n=1 Tax=Oryza rufipogon TaxID=4529 RepID=A0A0E0MWC1_ORYRU